MWSWIDKVLDGTLSYWYMGGDISVCAARTMEVNDALFKNRKRLSVSNDIEEVLPIRQTCIWLNDHHIDIDGCEDVLNSHRVQGACHATSVTLTSPKHQWLQQWISSEKETWRGVIDRPWELSTERFGVSMRVYVHLIMRMSKLSSVPWHARNIVFTPLILLELVVICNPLNLQHSL